MLESTRLRVFYEVARSGSFTAAANALGYTQPAISHQIAQLEKELGAQLVERGSRRLRLTPAGEVLFDHARSILASLADAERHLAETIEAGGRQLHIAAFPTASATILPPAVSRFRAANPAVELRLTEAEPPLAIPYLMDGACELALIYRYPLLRAPEESGVDLDAVFADQMALALPADHALAPASAVSLVELAAEPWVAAHDTACRDAFVHACRTAGFQPRVVSETNDYAAMQGLVAGGVGVGLVPRLAAGLSNHPGVVLRPLAERLIERVTFIATRSGAYRSPAAQVITSLLHQEVREATPSGLPLEPLEVETPTPTSRRRGRSRRRVASSA